MDSKNLIGRKRSPFRPGILIWLIVPAAAIALLFSPLQPAISFADLGKFFGSFFPKPGVAAAQSLIGTKLLAEGIELQTNGKYGDAIEKYRGVLDENTEPEAREARYLLGESLLLNDQGADAAKALADFLNRYPDDGRRQDATYQLALANRSAGEDAESVKLLSDYRAWPTTLDGYVALEIGKALIRQGKPQDAISELATASANGMSRLATVEALEQLAGAYDKVGDFGNAQATWQRLTPLARTQSYRAEVEYRQGLAALKAGRKDTAGQLLLDVARTYPDIYWAQEAMKELVKLNLDPGAYSRGIIAYFADTEADTVSAMNEILTAQPDGPQSAAVLNYRGLAYRYLGQPDKAVADFDRASTTYANQSKSDEAAFQGGRMLEALGRFPEAIVRYRRVVESFQTSDRWDEATYRLAMLQFQANDKSGSEATLLRLQKSGNSEFKTRAGLWLGKLMATRGDQEGAKSAWLATEQAAPSDYFGLRAKALREAETTPKTMLDAGTNPYPDLSDDRVSDEVEMVAWINTWAKTAVDGAVPPQSLLDDISFKRASELVRLNQFSEANEEIVSLVDRSRSDPATLYHLLSWAKAHRLARSQNYAGEALVAGSPAKNLSAAPKSVMRLALPVAYVGIVEEEGKANGVDPLLIAALVRQESLYDRYATSGSLARGLTQVIDSTAKDIAQRLGRTDFDPKELYRPATSIEFGAFYLRQQLKYFEGNTFAAVAAYNGGPGSVSKWVDGNNEMDPDSLLEKVTYTETQRYIELVGKYYYLYRMAYN